MVNVFKIVLCGSTLVGRTSLCTRYVDGVFRDNIQKTVGVEFALKEVSLPVGKKATLQLWDIGGENRFREMAPLYAGGAQGILYTFDLNRPASLEEVPEWFEIIDSEVPSILVGLKRDLRQRTQQEDIDSFLQDYEVDHFVATSALTGTNVEDPFTLIAQEVIK